MSFDIFERSIFGGKPIELYEFTRGGDVWRYNSTSSDISTVVGLYLSKPIERTAIEQNQDSGKKPVKITVSKDLPFVQQYISSPPSDIVTIKISRYHRGDTSPEIVIIWQGRVTNVSFETERVIIKCEPIFTSLQRPGLRRLYQTTCPHILYGDICKVVKSSFLTNATLYAVAGSTLSATIFSSNVDGYYAGGFVEWDNGVVVDKRFISSHIGDDIVLTVPFVGIPSTANIRVYPGCNRITVTCKDKFSNLDNYGGFPFIPTKNPFNGSPVF